jgi:hypothetical protein
MDTGRIEWVYPGEEATSIERDRFTKKLMIFGIIGMGVRRLKVFSEGQHSEHRKLYYRVTNCSPPTTAHQEISHFYYMQDNAPPTHPKRRYATLLKNITLTFFHDRQRVVVRSFVAQKFLTPPLGLWDGGGQYYQ